MLLEFICEMLTLIGGLIVAYFVYVLITKKNDAPSEESPAMAHTALREIVERAVEEAKKLPSLSGSPSETGKPLERKNIVDHSYEDLLATAILNKVIEKFQKEQVDGNSNVLREKPVSASKCALSENETGFDEGVEEGCSSLEPLSQDECGSVCSAFCPRHVRNEPESLSLTIEERIEEVTTTYTSDEDPRDNSVLAIRNAHRVPFPELGMDIIDPSQESSDDSQDEPDTPTPRIGLVSPIESWEENWLFQKKRIQSQADPVAMLVPNPSADFKALIGDKDAEDTSDLSECSSAQSDEEIEKELMEAIHNVVPRSPRGRESENGAGSCYEKSNGISMKFGMETPPSDVCMIKRKTGDLEKTESRVSINGSIEKIEREDSEENDEKYSVEVDGEYLARKVEVNEVDEAKEVRSPIVEDFRKEAEERSEKVITEREKPAPDNELKKTEMEEEIANEGSKENATENAANVNDSTNVRRPEERAEPAENNSSNSNDSMQLPMVFSQEETVSNVPKTPTCTPTRTSETDACTESENDAEISSSKEERVLNSLECAKKKLMAVDEDTADASKEEDKSDQQRIDLHAEDIQQESEYTEHYDIATQRHLDSLTKTDITVLENGATDRNMTDESKCREAVALAKAESASQLSLQSGNSEEEVQLATPPRPGTIAEREHKKWENAPPIENNPYSEENIQKRLWERQYSRRSSDIPGIHTELPKSNGADLEAVLTSQERDIKRFGRDYYINDSRASINEKGRRSAASTCSRPSSSLSQRSSSTSADQEQQVSFQLEKFEAASLRGSRTRWTYRDSHSSPHFAINPLLCMDLDDSQPSRSAEKNSDRVEHLDGSDDKLLLVECDLVLRTAEPQTGITETRERMVGRNHVLDENGEAECFRTGSEKEVESPRRNDLETITKEMTRRMSFTLNGSTDSVMFNPLYESEQAVPLSSEKCNRDGDSGMYSIDVHDVDDSEKQEQDRYRRLWISDWDNETKENQMLSSNGRKYWSFNGCKYHTFGGIKRFSSKPSDDSDEDNLKPETSDGSLYRDIADFSKLKFQTFGGIKESKKVDGKGMPAYRKIKLRPSLRNNKDKDTRSPQSVTVAQNDNELDDTENFGVTDIAYEYFDSRSVRRPDRRSEDTEFHRYQVEQVPKLFDANCKQGCKLKSFTGHSRTAPSSYYRSSSDDDWQDEDVYVPDKRITTRFLKDASKTGGSRNRSDDSMYFLNTSRKKMFDDGPKRIKPRNKHRSADDDESLKLEPPILPEVVERTFETLRDLRVKGNKKKRENCERSSNKKLGVRSLSDVTIW